MMDVDLANFDDDDDRANYKRNLPAFRGISLATETKTISKKGEGLYLR